MTRALKLAEESHASAASNAPDAPDATGARHGPRAETVETLGGGWIAEEAVAIALYCALVARDFEHGVRLAANISGDSDSTASMTGQILGVIGGASVIPQRWRNALELREVIEQLAADLALLATGKFDAEAKWDAYPGF